MLSPEQIRQQLQDANLRKVAARVDIHYLTLWRLMKGSGVPTYSTLQALSGYLSRSPSGEVVNG
jgi:transcriptional regulator with XRE-family HTH domain